jgi:hypothetical protein
MACQEGRARQVRQANVASSNMAVAPAVFVRAVAKQLGVPDPSEAPAELARRLGFTSYSSPRRVKRWLSTTGPNYEALMRMLEETGWLSGEARTALQRAEAEAAAAEAEAQRLARGVPRERRSGNG